MTTPDDSRRVLADYYDDCVWGYQAFRPSTVAVAVAKGTFGPGFGLERMTWIKPSFGWMLHRSNYASAKRQEAIARVKVRRSGFDKILRSVVLTLSFLIRTLNGPRTTPAWCSRNGIEAASRSRSSLP